MTCLLDASL